MFTKDISRIIFTFLKKKKKKRFFRNMISLSNSSDSDQARQSVGPDLGPNCLQMLSADNNIR